MSLLKIFLCNDEITSITVIFSTMLLLEDFELFSVNQGLDLSDILFFSLPDTNFFDLEKQVIARNNRGIFAQLFLFYFQAVLSYFLCSLL